MMKIDGCHKELGQVIPQLSRSKLRQLTRDLILDTHSSFAQIPRVSEYAERLRKGETLDCIDFHHFFDVYQDFERQEMEGEGVGRSEVEVQSLFLKGRYAYTLSIAARWIDEKTIHDFLYDLGYAFDESDLIWNQACEMARHLVERQEPNEEFYDRTSEPEEPVFPSTESIGAAPRKSRTPSWFTTWRWKRRIAKICKGESQSHVVNKLGQPSRRVMENGCDLWIYDLKRIDRLQYSIRVVLSECAVSQCYLGVEMD